MKLATKRDGSPDGALQVVSRDLARMVSAAAIVPTMQEALDNWERHEAALKDLSDGLNRGQADGAEPCDPSALGAVLPRAWQWLDASAFHSHGDLMEKVFGIDPPADKRTIPLIYQGAGDDLLGPTDDVPLPSQDDGMDFEAELVVLTDRVPMGTTATQAQQHVRLLTIANDVSLRALAGRELKTGFGFLQSKPATTLGPVAVTPDELGDAWVDGRVHLPVSVFWNNEAFGKPFAGAMGFSFSELIAHAARTRNLVAGTMIGSGTIANEAYAEVGSACIAERRAIELLEHGAPKTGFMKFGDRVRIEVLDSAGQSVFGAIDQRYVKAACA